MAWDRWKDRWISDSTVEVMEEKLFENLDAYTFLTEIIQRMDVDTKATYFNDIATDYDIKLEDDEEEEDE